MTISGTATAALSQRFQTKALFRDRVISHLSARYIAVAFGTVALFVAVGDNRGTPFGLTALSVAMLTVTGTITLINIFTADRQTRIEFALTGIIAVTAGVPVARLPHNREVLTVNVLSLLVIGASALFGRVGPRAPRGVWIVSLLFATLAAVTALSPDPGAIKQLVLVLIPSLYAFLFAGQLTPDGVRRIAAVIVSLGLAESALAVVEALALKTHIWATVFAQPATGLIAAVQNQVEVIQPNHLFGVELARSQGTFGHPLPLGLIIVVSLALVLRVLDVSVADRIAMSSVLVMGLLFTGDRNCLLEGALVLVFLSGTRLTATRFLVGLTAIVGSVLLAVSASLVSAATVASFTTTGSYTHRVGAYSSIGKLLGDQSLIAVVFGNGAASTARIFDAGLLQSDEFDVIDNQYVATLTHSGLIGLALLLTLSVLVVRAAPASLRPALFVVLATFLVFDTLLWPSASVLTFFVFGTALSHNGELALPAWPQSRVKSILARTYRGSPS